MEYFINAKLEYLGTYPNDIDEDSNEKYYSTVEVVRNQSEREFVTFYSKHESDAKSKAMLFINALDYQRVLRKVQELVDGQTNTREAQIYTLIEKTLEK